jgi:hypothetical protein
MAMAERTIFQPRFSLKIWVGERVSVLAKKNHHDVFSQTSRSLWKNIVMSLPNHWEDFFISLGRLFHTCMKKKKKHYDVFGRTL